MNSRFYFVFVVFWFTAILIFTVGLRSANNRLFYKLCRCQARQGLLKQQLGSKQLRLESIISPASVSQQLDQNKSDK